MKDSRMQFLFRVACFLISRPILKFILFFGAVSYVSIQFGLGNIEDPFNRSWVQSLMLFLGLFILAVTLWAVIFQFISNEKNRKAEERQKHGG